MSHNSNHGEKVRGGKKKDPALKDGPGATGHVPSEEVFWAELSSQAVLDVLTAVTGQGGAVMLTKSTDGGALGVRVYHDDHKVKTVWFRPDEDGESALDEITRYYTEYEAGGEDG